MKRTQLPTFLMALFFAWGLLLTGSLLLAQDFEPFSQELKLDNGTLPQQFEITLPTQGNVSMELIQFPPNATFLAEFPKGEGHFFNGDAGQARFPAGTYTMVIKEKWGRNVTEPIHIKTTVTPETDASEPNDTPAQARPVTLGDTDITVFPKGEVDYLKINLSDRGYLVIQPTEPPKGFTGHFEVFDENNQNLGANGVHIPYPGEYLIKCTDKWASFGSLSPVKIKMDFYQEEDHAEPNNTIDDAAEIPLGTWQQAMAAPATDVDFHALEINSTGRLNLHVGDLDKNIGLDYRIYDEKGLELKREHPFTVTPGKYYVQVYARYNAWSLQPYRLKFDLLPIEKITPEGEEMATTIEPGQNYYTRIQSGADSDRFHLKLQGQSIVTARLTVPEGSDYRMVYQLKGGNEISQKNVWFRTSDPEVNFVIKPYYNQYSYAPLTVWTEVENEFDPSEPNDTSVTPADLELAKPRLFFLYPNQDTDWFKVRIDEPGTYYLHVVQTSEDSLFRFNSLETSLHDTAGKRLDWLSLQATDYGFTSTPFEIKEAGEYLIYITSNGSSKAPLMVGLNREANLNKHIADDTGGVDVFVVGVELGPDAANRMEGMVNTGGGSFINAENAADIGDKLVAITDVIEERSSALANTSDQKKSSNTWWLWLILLTAGILVTAWLKRQMHNKADASDI